MRLQTVCRFNASMSGCYRPELCSNMIQCCCCCCCVGVCFFLLLLFVFRKRLSMLLHVIMDSDWDWDLWSRCVCVCVCFSVCIFALNNCFYGSPAYIYLWIINTHIHTRAHVSTQTFDSSKCHIYVPYNLLSFAVVAFNFHQ